MKKNSLITTTLGVVLLVFSFSSCQKKGCTDPKSYTYDADAKDDDGSCEYLYGGETYGKVTIGSEIKLYNIYDVYIDGDYKGRLSYYFPNGLSCGADDAVSANLPEGSHYLEAIGSGGTEIRSGWMNVSAQACKVVYLNSYVPTSTTGTTGTTGSTSTTSTTSTTSSTSTTSTTSSTSTTSTSSTNGGNETGDITFWLIQDLGCGSSISVTISSYGTRSITSYYGGNPGCGASGCANFTNMPYGAYYYTATSGSCSWSGTIYLSDDCYTLQLTM